MSLREIFNAISGFTEFKRQEFSVLWNVAQYNAMRSSLDKEQQKQIKKDKNPFLDEPKEDNEPMKYNDVVPMLKSISKRKN